MPKIVEYQRFAGYPVLASNSFVSLAFVRSLVVFRYKRGGMRGVLNQLTALAVVALLIGDGIQEELCAISVACVRHVVVRTIRRSRIKHCFVGFNA